MKSEDNGKFILPLYFGKFNIVVKPGKKSLHISAFSDKLNSSEKVESVMLMHVRHFATVSIVCFRLSETATESSCLPPVTGNGILQGKEDRVSFMGHEK